MGRVHFDACVVDGARVTVNVSQAEWQRQLAAAHAREVDIALSRAARHERGDDGETVIRDLVAPLVQEGWRALHSRRWPGTRNADIDHLLIGPGGVIVLDTKNWRGHVRFAGGRLWQGQDDVTEAIDGLAAQVKAVEEVMTVGGLAPLEVVGSLVFVDQPIPYVAMGRIHIIGGDDLLRWLRARGQRLHPDTVANLAALAEEHVPPMPTGKRPIVPVARRKPQPRIAQDQAELFSVQALDLDELERASRLPLEQWMIYLHPAQLDVVRRRYNGPCRIRGAAGCGKTVVALHRAAYLASQEPGDLLFLTYVRTLPRVLASLFGRLAPHSLDRVRFSGVHSLALEVLHDAGIRPRLNVAVADTCFNRAWTRLGREHLARPTLGRDYWHEEVRNVIKGRGLADFEDYRSLPRTGRRTPLNADQRRRVWDLYVEYQKLLDAHGVQDFEDVVADALAVAERSAAKTYRFVLVDEAQDLDLLSVRLATALVSDPRDGLTLVGDGQQAIYPGGYTLKEAGLTVSGRSTVLDVNYRNTRQVLEAARDLVRGDDFDDLEDVGESGDRPVTVLRDGAAVLTVTAADSTSAELALCRRLVDDLALGLPASGAAVLCRTKNDAIRLRTLIAGAGVPVQDLEQYNGSAVEAVKVGTVKRAKGLEFQRVYVPRVDSYKTEDGSAEPERVQRERRELFVAMTRARDGLWMSRVDPR
jgi:hypothetical protein